MYLGTLLRSFIARLASEVIYFVTSVIRPSVSNSDGFYVKNSLMKNLYWFSRFKFEIVDNTLIYLSYYLDIVFQFDTLFFRIVQFSRYKWWRLGGSNP